MRITWHSGYGLSLVQCRFYLLKLLVLVAALWMGGSVATFGQAPSDVLILNSYHPGYAWSDGELRGLLGTLLGERPLMLPSIEHLDWKRWPTPEREAAFVESLRLKYGSGHVRVVITLDDKAFELALRERSVFADAPIIFGGVNSLDPERYGAAFTNLTGVVESKDFPRTLDLIQRLQPEVREVVGYHDGTESSLGNRRALEDAMVAHAPELTCRFIEGWTKEELLDQLSQLEPSCVAFSLGANRDAAGVLLSDDLDFLRMCAQRSSVPIYLISEPIVPLFSTADWNAAVWSGVGGSLVSGERHGEQVGQLALRVLDGEQAENIPIITNSMGRLAVDWRQMKRFALPLGALPEGTEIYNQPVNFYRIHKNSILAGGAVLLLLGCTVVILSINIVWRHRTEHQNKQLVAALERAGEIVIMIDADTDRISYVNPALTKVSGWPEATVRATSMACFSPDREGNSLARFIGRLQETETYSERLECLHQNGSPLQLSFAGTVTRDAAGVVTHYILLAHDVTREVTLEEQVRTAQKMEAVGVLAGGIAHDFNNLLQVVIGNAQLAMDPSLSEEEHADCIEQVLTSARSGVHLPRQLLAFGRRQSLQREDTDLSTLVADFLIIIRKLIGAHIEVDFVSNPGIGNVNADHRQLEQVIMNLCVNGRDAMPEGGTLSIRIENRALDEEFGENHAWARAGKYVCLSVRDFGAGIDGETLKHIFEPFFTTKPMGRGTGLGLAVVYGIVQQHEGLIQVESVLGEGTTINIYLQEEEPKKQPGGGPSAAAPSGESVASGTILLAEDEVTVRQICARILKLAGYGVVEVENGQEAVKRFEADPDEFDLILMDMVMPKMTGPVAAERIGRIRPDLPVLFSSGYSSDWIDPSPEGQPLLHMIQKPYNSEDLLAKIESILKEKR